LSEVYLYPVCAPSVARRLKTPQDVYSATIIRNDGARDNWDDWARVAGLTEPLVASMSFSEAGMCVDAAIAGLGVALTWDFTTADALDDGRLVRPFKEQLVSSFGLWFVTAKSRGSDPKVSAFRAWMKRQLRK
ncbi:LysR substrate-binding domain-containing protein, partial [Tabrizicola sp.]|uniref:LysR substrate-binding domain-containing protein n=1 Tax=Tabrizicola sp. TaxID=2005166 RepID=UPI003F39D406